MAGRAADPAPDPYPSGCAGLLLAVLLSIPLWLLLAAAILTLLNALP